MRILPHLAALAVAGLWACGETTDAADAPGVVVSGRVVTDADSAITAAEVRVFVSDTSFTLGREVMVRADHRGRFTAWVPLDTVLPAGRLRILARAALGSGLQIAEEETELGFSEGGRATAPDMTLTVVRSGPPVPAAPPVPLTASRLAGRRYQGWTIDPQTWIYNAMSLDLTFAGSADSIHGRYEVDYTATRVCGNGRGTFTGVMRADTLFLRLTSDSFPGWTPPPIITDFTLVTHDASADTLVATEVVAPSGCGLGEAVPVRLLRQ